MTQKSTEKKGRRRETTIPRSSDVARVRYFIRSNTRDLLLFDLAVETGVTAGQLLKLRVKDLFGLNVGDKIPSLSSVQSRIPSARMGQQTHNTFQRYLIENSSVKNDFLFRSKKSNKALLLPSASRLLSSWFEKAGLTNMNGFLSLRKYRGTYSENKLIETSGPQAPEILPPLKSLRRQTAQELVYAELVTAIVTARLKPGDRLVTEELEAQMGLSRIPIREAIARLEARNFITIIPQKGATVNKLSDDQLKEILEIRLMLELPVARKAAIAATDSLITELNRLNKKFISAQKKKNRDKLVSLNREFHFAIYKIANMPILYSMLQNLWDLTSPYFHLMFRQDVLVDKKNGYGHHEKIINAMVSHDPEEICKWLKIGIIEETESLLKVMHQIRLQNPKS